VFGSLPNTILVGKLPTSEAGSLRSPEISRAISRIKERASNA